MKVALINGSPRRNSCTLVGLQEVAKTLNTHGVETEIISLGTTPFAGCIACLACKNDKRECVFNDFVNEFGARLHEFDGFVFGSPVHYASISSSLKSFMDRLFYSHGDLMSYKPATAVVCSRRAGELTTFDQLNKYFSVHSMPIVTSQYWNNIHGATPEDVLKDEEGLQTLRSLGANMAWLLKCIEAGKLNGVNIPMQTEERIRTNFVS